MTAVIVAFVVLNLMVWAAVVTVLAQMARILGELVRLVREIDAKLSQ